MGKKRLALSAVLAGCLLAAFLAVAYPMYVIRPFRAQGPNELMAALGVRSWAPVVAPIAAVIALVAAVSLWRSSCGRMGRILGSAAAALTVAFAALTYVNIFELMFHRIDAPDAIAARDAKLEADDMVLAVNTGGHARAYPIRMMGYHHIVNDWVGGVPIVATY